MPTHFARPAATLALSSLVIVWPAGAAAQLGSSYCPAVANSTGTPARIVAVGSVDISFDQLELRCEGLSAGTVGLFLFGRDEALLPGHGGNVGTLCLAAPFTRDPLGPLQASQGGDVRRALDLASVHCQEARRVSAPATRCGCSTGTATRPRSAGRRTRAKVIV